MANPVVPFESRATERWRPIDLRAERLRDRVRRVDRDQLRMAVTT